MAYYCKKMNLDMSIAGVLKAGIQRKTNPSNDSHARNDESLGHLLERYSRGS